MSKNPPAKLFTHAWTPEKLARQDRKSVEKIRERALKLEAVDLVKMCDDDIASRPSTSPKRPRLGNGPGSRSGVVVGYHFVCSKECGVSVADNGRFWSGSWVVAEANVRNSINARAYLALHESKAELSYRQGTIVDYRRSPRDMLSENESGGSSRTEEGIEFLVEGTNEPYAWVGDGAGEKGYRWAQSGVENSSLGSVS